MKLDKFDLLCEKMLNELDKDYAILSESVETTPSGYSDAEAGKLNDDPDNIPEDPREQLQKNLKLKADIANQKKADNFHKLKLMSASPDVSDASKKTMRTVHKRSVIAATEAENKVRTAKLEESDDSIYLFAAEFDADILAEAEQTVSADTALSGIDAMKARENEKYEKEQEEIKAKEAKARGEAEKKAEEERLKLEKEQQLEAQKKQEEMLKKQEELAKKNELIANKNKVNDEHSEEMRKLTKKADAIKALKSKEQSVIQTNNTEVPNATEGDNMKEEFILENKESRNNRQLKKAEKHWEATNKTQEKLSMKLVPLQKKYDILSAKMKLASEKNKLHKRERILKQMVKLENKMAEIKTRIDQNDKTHKFWDEKKAHHEFIADTMSEGYDLDLELLLLETDRLLYDTDIFIEELDAEDDIEENNPVVYEQVITDPLEDKRSVILSESYSDPMLRNLATRIEKETDRQKLSSLIISFNQYKNMK